MLSNSLVAGAAGDGVRADAGRSSSIPRCRWIWRRLVPLVTTVGLFYAVHLTVICYVLLVLRQLLAREVFSPAWISVSVLVWLCACRRAAGRR